MSENEWYGEPHTLIVHEVEPLTGDEDPGYRELGDYNLEHPPSCKQEEFYGGRVLDYTCDVAHEERACGLAASLHYSGTPVTEPGTYRIQSWGRKYYVWDYGAWEHDGGVGVMDPEAAA
jgi:hypothetical protein